MLLQDPRPLEDKRDELAKVLPAPYAKMLFCVKHCSFGHLTQQNRWQKDSGTAAVPIFFTP